MTNQGWYFTLSSDEYGSEEFGGYDTEQEAQEGIVRVKARAEILSDGITRYYSEPYQKPIYPFGEEE